MLPVLACASVIAAGTRRASARAQIVARNRCIKPPLCCCEPFPVSITSAVTSCAPSLSAGRATRLPSAARDESRECDDERRSKEDERKRERIRFNKAERTTKFLDWNAASVAACPSEKRARR